MASARTGILVILDGFGYNPSADYNAIAAAQTPVWDELWENGPRGLIEASEKNVGLPGGFMGNSEVGHLNIGAGRIVHQDFSLISDAIDKGHFFENHVFLDLISKVKASKGATLHLVGLVSDGGVHSHVAHVRALLQLAKQQEVARVAVHVILDGRDTSPTSGIGFVRELQSYCKQTGVGTIESISGRFYAMDRDKRWDRTEKAYQAMVSGLAKTQFDDPSSYVQGSYEKEVTDEFMEPAVRRGYKGLKDGDGVVFFNFRADRARQLTYAVTQLEFPHFVRKDLPALSGFVGMTCYDENLDVPFAYGKPEVPNTVGEVVSQQGWQQLRIAETEKYAHVTYFFNGGKEALFEGEKRVLIPSPKDVRTYDQKPEMSAEEVTEKLIEALETQDYRFAVVNFANPDMVGHTGNFPAAVKAIETVDKCLGQIVDWVESNNAFALITADHGNCELMRDPDGMPLTAHTLNTVPVVLVDPKAKKSLRIRPGGRLCDVAPTLLDLWELRSPSEMTGKSLIQKS